MKLAAGKSADDRHAHSLSPSSLSSQSELGETVPSPFIDNLEDRNVDLGDGNLVVKLNKDISVSCTPSV